MPASAPQGPVSSLAAAQLIREANDKVYTSAAKAEILGMQGQLNAKAQQATNASKSAAGSMLDATSKFVGSGAGIITNTKLAMKGAGPMKPLRQQKDEADAAFAARTAKQQSNRMVMSSLANTGSVPQTIDKATDALSQTVGGQAEVNAAKIADKQAELSETVGKNQQEGFKSLKERAAKGIDDGTEFQKSAQDRLQQTLANIANRI